MFKLLLILDVVPSSNGLTLRIFILSDLFPHWTLIVPFEWTDVISQGSLRYLDSALRRIPLFVFAVKSVWTYQVYTQHFPRSCYDQLWWNMSILLAVSLIHLARSARFDIFSDGMSHTFPIHHGSQRFLKTWVPRVLEVVVIPTDSPVL